MPLFQGFRHWFNRPSLLASSKPIRNDAYYNQYFFETQDLKAVRYRHVQTQPLSPTAHLAKTVSSDSQVAILALGEGGERVPPTVTSAQKGSLHHQPLNQAQHSGFNGLTKGPSMQTHKASHTVVSLFLDQAKGYASQSQWDKAIAVCHKVMALDPKQAEAHRLIGNALYAMKHPYEAMGYYADALVLHPQSIALYTDLGHLYQDLQQWEQAITYYQTAIDLASTSSTTDDIATTKAAQAGLIAAQIAGKRQTHKKQHQVDTIYHSLSLSPETFTAEEHSEMGELLLQQGDGDNALECFHRAIECQPSCVAAHLQLAALLEERQQWKAAMFHYKQASDRPQQILQLEQGTSTPLSPSQTQRHHHSAPKSSAPSALSPNTATSPSGIKPLGPPSSPTVTAHRDSSDPLVASIQSFVALARSYEEHGDLEKAIAHYRNALSLDPKNPDLHRELTLVLGQQTP